MSLLVHGYNISGGSVWLRIIYAIIHVTCYFFLPYNICLVLVHVFWAAYCLLYWLVVIIALAKAKVEHSFEIHGLAQAKSMTCRLFCLLSEACRVNLDLLGDCLPAVLLLSLDVLCFNNFTLIIDEWAWLFFVGNGVHEGWYQHCWSYLAIDAFVLCKGRNKLLLRVLRSAESYRQTSWQLQWVIIAITVFDTHWCEAPAATPLPCASWWADTAGQNGYLLMLERYVFIRHSFFSEIFLIII